MITARFYRKPSNGSIHMTLKGHADAAPKGEDLICASATMLAYTVAQAVQFMFENNKLKKKPIEIHKQQKMKLLKTTLIWKKTLITPIIQLTTVEQ